MQHLSGASSGDADGRQEPSSGSGGKAPPITAQKRFRARQKEKMGNLEKEVAEKRAEFDQLAAENQQLRARTNILEKVVSCRDEQLKMVTAFEEHCSSRPSTSSCFGAASSLNADALEPSVREGFANMKKEQIIPRYKGFLTEVSSYLLNCQHPCCDASNPTYVKVAAAVERIGAVLKHVLLLNSALMRQLLSLNLETLQPAAAPDAHWDGVVTSLQLLPDQSADILAVFDLYRSLITRVYEERKLIMSALGGGVRTLEPSCTTFVQRNAMPEEMELMERLSSNLSKEHSAQTLLCCFLFGKVLAPPQFAKVAVYSWPLFPDSLAIASAVARRSNYFATPPLGGAAAGAGGAAAAGAGSAAAGGKARNRRSH